MKIQAKSGEKQKTKTGWDNHYLIKPVLCNITF